MCEYLLNYSLLGLSNYSKYDIYVDVGSNSTPSVMTLREKYGINAYGVDLCKNPLNKDYYLQEDATKTSFDDNSVSGISLQSTFCLFMGKADIEFINELSRILKSGGKAVISPLYLYKEYISLVSPQYYGKGYNDPGSKEYIRRDWPNIYMSRYYSPEKLKERIIDTAKKFGLRTTVLVLDNSQVPYYEFAYLKFLLLIEKN